MPAQGGEICLLPGTHLGPVDLRKLSNIKIHGCGARSLVAIAADPNAPNRPGFWLDDASAIRFSDFACDGAGGPVFGAGNRCQDIDFARLRIRARQTAAIVLARTRRATIADCQIAADALDRALEPADLANLLPLIFLAGESLRIERNQITAAFEKLNRNRVALGGILIGGRSRDVTIEDNRISGGNGHGITLGSFMIESRPGEDGPIIFIPPWLTIDEDGCIKLQPGGTGEFPGTEGHITWRSAGPIKGLRIRDNSITDQGGCGISVVHWFIAGKDYAVDELDDIEIDEVMIDDNRIHRCMAINLSSALSVEAAFNSGFGGIALASATDITIRDNEVRDCGGNGRSPICGIYIRYAERLRITGNRISDNGRPASLTDPLLVGNIGGIVIGHVDGVEESLGTGVRETPAAVISGNVVVTPEGRALELIGSGQMLVQGNALTSHGNNIGALLLRLFMALLQPPDTIGDKVTDDQLEGQFRAAISQIGGSAVLIFNTGIDRNLALFSMWLTAHLDKEQANVSGGPQADGAADGNIAASSNADRSSTAMLATKGVADYRVNRSLPCGPVSFADNMVIFDLNSDAITLSLSSIAILSLDDVGMHDNHCAIDLTKDLVFANALVLGLVSCRVIGNRFRETLPIRQPDQRSVTPSTLFSAVTVGLLNATELNQGDHCFVVLGAKKPRVVMEGNFENPTFRLDTNRHLLDDDLCESAVSFSNTFGTK